MGPQTQDGFFSRLPGEAAERSSRSFEIGRVSEGDAEGIFVALQYFKNL